MRMKRFSKYWLPAIFWVVVIFFFSSFPTKQTTEIFWQDFLLKKTAHFIEFGILAVLLYRAFINSGFKTKNAIIYSVIFFVLYAISDEFHQSFIPGREPRVRDVIIDMTGGILSLYSIKGLLPQAPVKVKYWAKKFDIVQ